MVKVSVVILNWNGAEDTIECLKSVNKLSIIGCKLSVVVVDNSSTDDSVEKIKPYLQSTSFKLLINKENLGFAGGNNVGIRYALRNGADYVVVLNNDTIVDKNLVDGLLETARKYPRAGAISPKIYFAKGYEFHKKRYKNKDLGRVIWYAGGVMDWDNIYGKNRGVDETDEGQYQKTLDTDFATGACVLLRSTAIKAVGMFDEKYFMYLEDVDLSQRMKRQGWRVLYTHRACLCHKVAQSSGIGGDLNDYFITRNRLLFGMKYASLRAKFALYRESLRILWSGREWQKKGVLDFYLGRFGKGSWVSR